MDTSSHMKGNRMMAIDIGMMAIDIGMICIKKSGREAGKKCVIVDMIDKSFVLVTGPRTLSGVKRRRVNIRHIESTNDKLKISRSASDEDVMKAVEAAGKTEEMKARF